MIDCSHSMALTIEDLVRYTLDGEALPPALKAHLDQCIVCQQHFVRYTYTHTRLLMRLYRSQCPGSTQLSHYCAGLLCADEGMSIARHVSMCPLCAEEVADIHHILTDSETLFVRPSRASPWSSNDYSF